MLLFRLLSPLFPVANMALFGFYLHLNDLFCPWECFFKKMDIKKKEKEKKKAGKLEDLVCTRRIFLYKSSQISDKRQKVCYSISLLSFITVWNTRQMRPNEAKCEGLLLLKFSFPKLKFAAELPSC